METGKYTISNCILYSKAQDKDTSISRQLNNSTTES